MPINWPDPDDRKLAANIFGTDDPQAIESMILDWAAAQGFAEARIDSIELSVGAAVAVGLPAAARIFVKVWPGRNDPGALGAQMDLQGRMAARGFPAPAVLTKLAPLGAGWAVAMQYDRSGAATDVRIAGVRSRMASGLASFVRIATQLRDIPDLPRRALPPDGAIWPEPHSVLFDLRATARGAEWIDELAGDALTTMRSALSPVVVAHHDWSAKNMRMGPDGIAVVYDWDAVFLDCETFCLGSAAAHFPVTWELDVPETPSVGEVGAFVRDYEDARGTAFTTRDLVEIAAAATYARAYKARCEHAIDPEARRWRGSSRESLKVNGPFRHFSLLSHSASET